jgi:hypothetical protein
MKFQSHSRIGVTAFVAASLFWGCGVKPAPTEEQTAALLHGGPPLLVRECERLLNDCERLRRPRLRDACVREVLRGECGHPPHADAGRSGMDGSANVPEAGRRDAGSDVGQDAGICDPSRMSCNRDAGRDVGGTKDAAADAARDGAHSTDGALDSGARVDASVDVGLVSACPGTTTPGPLPAGFNCVSRGSNCGSCLVGLAGGENVCASCSNDQAKSDCLALLQCIGQTNFSCLLALPGGGVGCYCSDASCSAGANGLCARQFQAIAGTTDSAEVLRQIQDPSTTIHLVLQEGQRYAGAAGCAMFCGCVP